jgi:DNA-binding CsgD family transcriptional regulator
MADTTKNIPLSERELELLKLVSTGATNQQTARALGISVNTVKVHLRNIFEKMGVESRTEATLVAIREGWIVVDNAVEAAAPADTARPARRISRGQRVFLAAATVIVLGLMLWLPESARLLEGQSQSLFTERPAAMPLLVADERTARWSRLTDMQIPRGRLAAVYYDGAIYAVAGDTEVGVSASLERYDVGARAWTSLPDKPTGVGNVAAVVAGGRIWTPGGFLSNGRITSLVETYDLEAGVWDAAPSLPGPVCAYALAAVGDDVYLFGGADNQGYLNVAYRFDAEAGEWQTLTPMPSARSFASAAVLEGLIYVVGGYDGQRELDTCAIYDPAEEAAGRAPWKSCAPLTVGRGGLGLAAAGSTLYAVGGGWQNFLAYNEQYDPETDQWTQFSTPVSGEWRNLALVSDDKMLYALGGWDGQYVGSLWMYRTMVTIFLPFAP